MPQWAKTILQDFLVSPRENEALNLGFILMVLLDGFLKVVDKSVMILFCLERWQEEEVVAFVVFCPRVHLAAVSC